MTSASIHSLPLEILLNIFSHLLSPTPSHPLVLYPQYQSQEDRVTTRFPRSAVHCSTLGRRADSIAHLVCPSLTSGGGHDIDNAAAVLGMTAMSAGYGSNANENGGKPQLSCHLEDTFRNTRLTCRAFANIAVQIFFSENTFQANNLPALSDFITGVPDAWRIFVRKFIFQPSSLFRLHDNTNLFLFKRFATREVLGFCRPFRLQLDQFENLRSIEIRVPFGFAQRRQRLGDLESPPPQQKREEEKKVITAAMKSLRTELESLQELKVIMVKKAEVEMQERRFKQEDCRGVVWHALLVSDVEDEEEDDDEEEE